jgi:hypothetical protein
MEGWFKDRKSRLLKGLSREDFEAAAEKSGGAGKESGRT